jgi:hypothetical protein
LEGSELAYKPRSYGKSRKLYFALNPSQEEKYKTLSERPWVRVNGWPEPVPPDQKWIEARREITETSLQEGRRLMGIIPSLTCPVVLTTPVIAQVGDTLYYFSAGFLTFKQSDFTSCLSADRRLPRLQCRVAARVRLMTASDTWNPALRC